MSDLWMVYALGVALVSLWSLSDDITDTASAVLLGVCWPILALGMALGAVFLLAGIGLMVVAGVLGALDHAWKWTNERRSQEWLHQRPPKPPRR